jgi:DNA-binding NarL/FixJ family response regulator
VDDDADLRALLVDLFRGVGYSTVEAVNANEALEAAKRERPSLVLLDVNLPLVSGYEVCRKFRDEYGEQLPIVFISGERMELLDRVAGLLIGADDYIVKPFEVGELLARVRRSLTRGTLDSNGHGHDTFGLTAREREVLALLAEGLTQSAIAVELFISTSTVGTHIQRILTKLGVHTRAEAIAIAYRAGLVPNAPVVEAADRSPNVLDPAS